MTATCPSCGCEQGAGLLCSAETDRLECDLGDVAAIVAELDVTLSRQARIGTSGGKSGVMANHRDGFHGEASRTLGTLTNTLGTWARDVSGETWLPALSIVRVGRNPHTKTEGPFCLSCPHRSCMKIRTEERREAPHPAMQAAGLLLSAIPLVRRHPAVSELVDEITYAVSLARRDVDRPADRIYLGQCMVETPDPDGRQVTCLAEIWARPSAAEVRCTVCMTEHPVAERRAWLLTKAADMIVTVKEAASYLGEVGGIKVTESSIRGYLHRHRLAYRAPVESCRFRLGDLLEVVLDEGERKSA